MLQAYLNKISETASLGAREESYYPALSEFLEKYAGSVGKTGIHVLMLPKKTEAGNPDFKIWDGKQRIIGYIEAKDPSVEDLDRIAETEQLKRYRHTFPNLILTNFLEFRLYREGNLVEKVLVGRPFILHELKVTPPAEKESELLALLEKFFSFSFPRIYSARTLAIELAKRTRFLKDAVVTQELAEEAAGKNGYMLAFYRAFKDYLISGLTMEEFADLYSQTIAYGLFAARSRAGGEFNRKLAYANIPHTIGILRDVFRFISLEDLPQQMEWIVDDISEVLAVTDAGNILHEYFYKHKGKDPIVHFYETFLAEYDPKTREKRGVYYTPEPVVSYIVHSLNIVLKKKFGKADGLADQSVTVLDPAAGTLTFLAEAARVAVEEFVSKYGEGAKESFIKEHVLKNYYAFELMMAPYAVGHLKMSFLLEELGYRLQNYDRSKLYLTNTLEMEPIEKTQLPGMASLSEESHLAEKVKKDQPILVILGNPPYSGISANLSEKEREIPEGTEYVAGYEILPKNNHWTLRQLKKRATKKLRKKQKTWIGEQIEYYKIVNGHWLDEKNPKWLQDDYVKFIRFAQWKIDQAGAGIVGFITNHSYLDNPTFRGMRQSLMSSFNEIYIIDLHGNSLKKEKAPDGSQDENVFDIRQGVAIMLLVKTKGETEHKVYHSDAWGIREKKYSWLAENDISTTKWQQLSPRSESYLLAPRTEKLFEAYEKYPRITEIFPINSVGIVTSRDNFVIDFDKETLKRRVIMLRNEKMPDEIIAQAFQLREKPNWKLRDARKKIQLDDKWESSITHILYRPFDVRWIFYNDVLIERSRKEIMRHMLSNTNIGLIMPRRVEVAGPWNHAFISNCIVEHVAVSLKTIDYLFPLHIFPNEDKGDLSLFNMSNIDERLYARLADEHQSVLQREQILYYVYAVLYSNTYRTKYAEFLKADFPRIPLARDSEHFKNLAKLGLKLVELHLFKSAELDTPIIKYEGVGDNRVDKVRYNEAKQCVYFNGSQYFEGVPKEAWEYRIGGYQVCEKWLKDRKGRTLSLDDIKHYCRVVTALKKTIEAQQAIDEIYPAVEKDHIEFTGI